MKKHYNWVDILSGLAILMIFFAHSTQEMEGINTVLYRLSAFGSRGCQLLFFLSGFKLSLSFSEQEENFGIYIRKRYKRIGPTWLLFLTIWFLLTFVLEQYNLSYGFRQNRDWVAVLLNALLLHGIFYRGLNDVVPGGWYIGTIILLYWTFPFLYKLVKKWSKKMIILSILLLPILVRVLALCIQTFCPLLNVGEYGILGQIIYFYFGIAFHQIHREKKVNGSGMIISCLLFVGMIVLKVSCDFMKYIVGPLSEVVLIWCVVYWARAWEQRGQDTVLFKTIKLFGSYSMELYYLHFFVVWYVFPISYALVQHIGRVNISLWWIICVIIGLPLLLGAAFLLRKMISSVELFINSRREFPQ